MLKRLLACYAPDAIPLSLLTEASAATLDPIDPALRLQLAPLAEDPLRSDQAVADLLRYSLLTPSRTGAGAVGGLDGRVVSMHRLVQAVTLDQLPGEDQQRWRHAARTLLGAALPTDPEDPAGWPTSSSCSRMSRSSPTAPLCPRGAARDWLDLFFIAPDYGVPRNRYGARSVTSTSTDLDLAITHRLNQGGG